jgi:hypothetical protein
VQGRFERSFVLWNAERSPGLLEGRETKCTYHYYTVFLVLIRFTQGLAVFEEISCVRVANPAEITGLAFDAPSNRLAVCHRGGMVQVYTLGSTMSMQEVFTLELKNAVPRAIAFGQMHGNERDIMVFGLYGGDM